MTRLQELKNPKLGKERYKVWLTQSKYDLKAAKLSLKNHFNEWAAYQSEQAAEKAIKSVIVNSGYIAPRTHKLSVLIGITNGLNPIFANTKFHFRFLDTFSLVSRYPFLIPKKKQPPHTLISDEDAERLVGDAERIIKKISVILDSKDIPSDSPKHKSIEIKDVDLQKRLKEIQSQIKKAFDVEKIILFGSYARDENVQPDTMIDILIIANTELSFSERLIKARDVTSGSDPAVQPLVYTPEEYKLMIEEEGEGFFEIALSEGKILYKNDN